MKRLPILVLLSVILLAACQSAAPSTPSAPREITLNLTYIPNIQFAPIYVAIDQGYFAEEGLDVKLAYGNEADYIALIGSNSQQFMIGSAEQVLLARGQGLPVVTVMDWYKDYPVGIVSLASANIKTPQDLVGKTIGLPGLYGASYIGFEALIHQYNFSDADFQLRSIGFTQVESLVSGQLDAAVIYLANEPVQLRQLGYEVNVMRVADSVALVGNGLITNEKTVADDPQLVSGMARALWRGIAETEEDPEKAFQISTQYVDNLGSDRSGVQEQVLAESIKLWCTSPQESESASKWQNMASVLLQMGLLKEPVDLTKAFNYGFNQ